MTATHVDVRVRIPDPLPDHTKCWAKTLEGVDQMRFEGDQGGRAIRGQWLDRGTVYHLPERLLLVTVDRTTSGVRVTLWRVTPGTSDGLSLVYESTNRSGRIGKRILRALAVRYRDGNPPVVGDVRQLRDTPEVNQFKGTCRKCDQTVHPGSGLVIRKAGLPLVQHVKCPPRVNRYEGECGRCGGRVAPLEGVLIPRSEATWPSRYDAAREAAGEKLSDVKPVHRECPPPTAVTVPKPQKNERRGPCARCHQEVPAYRGVLIGEVGSRMVVHPGETCPPYPHGRDGERRWTIAEVLPHRRSRPAYDYPAGTVARVTLPDGPEEGPGWRQAAGGATSVVGVVLASAEHHSRDEHGRWATRHVTVWRVATPGEAAPVLEGEERRLAETGLVARARRLLALLPNLAPEDAHAPSVDELLDASYTGLPRVWVPSGAGRPETEVRLDEQSGVVWTVVNNNQPGDDWSLSNWGGYAVYHHPLTPERAALLADLRAHQETTSPTEMEKA